MWGSNMPQLSAFTAKLTADGRFASRVAKTAGQYVALLQSYANTASYEYPMLLNVSDDVDWVIFYRVGQEIERDAECRL